MHGYADIDDAAAAFAWMLPRREALARQFEFASGIVPLETGGYGYSEPKTSREKGSFSVPLPRAMQALIHNHPSYGGLTSTAERFSDDDRDVAHTIKKPSYVATPTGRVHRYDPATKQTSEVLAQFPIDEFRGYLMRKLLERAPNDSRGLMR